MPGLYLKLRKYCNLGTKKLSFSSVKFPEFLKFVGSSDVDQTIPRFPKYIFLVTITWWQDDLNCLAIFPRENDNFQEKERKKKHLDK